MNAKDELTTYIEVLHANRHIIAESYHRGFVTSDADAGVAMKGIMALKGYRALVPRTQDSFRLRTSLRDHLDDVLLKSRLYTAVGSGLAEHVSRLPQLYDEVRNAHVEGRMEDAARYTDDFSSAVFELSDSVSMALSFMRTQADTKFSHVTTLAEKQRQNEFYIQRAEKIGEALESLSRGRLLEAFSEFAPSEELGVLFRHEIWDHLPQWRSSLLDITQILKEFLYRLRQIAPATRRFRAFALHLKRNPDWQAPSLDEAEEPVSVCRRAAALPMARGVDVKDDSLRGELIAIAQRLPTLERPVQKEAPKGELKIDGDDAAQSVVVPVHNYHRAWRSFLPSVAAAGVGGLSALIWKRSQIDWQVLDDELWLIWVLNECAGGARRKKVARVQMRTESDGPLSGNLILRDVQVYPL